MRLLTFVEPLRADLEARSRTDAVIRCPNRYTGDMRLTLNVVRSVTLADELLCEAEAVGHDGT